MKGFCCVSCRYYIQHYALCEEKLIRVYCGHCTYARAKTTRPDKKACMFFEQGTDKEDSFVRREYLSKKLLDKVLSMELLPQIEEGFTAEQNR
ncbi:MAG: hypothetical protein J6L88_07035 [Clostridia bacterium]|nr:hypothetical protein [Clostridia bacterium]